MNVLGRVKLFFFCYMFSYATAAFAGFEVIALGVEGGVVSDNLTSYLLRATSETRYVVLDAGTTFSGVVRAVKSGLFQHITESIAQPDSVAGYILRHLIDCYFISHAHLDHIVGLVMASPDDLAKSLYASPETITTLSETIFNWQIWPNLTKSGVPPALGPLQLHSIAFYTPFTLGQTGLTGKIYPLSHAGHASAMLLVSYANESFAFFGDTGADVVEKSNNLEVIWQELGKQLTNKRLKGIIIEVSYPNSIADDKLYGHLTPAWLLHELQVLHNYSGGENSLRDFPVVISHIKPSLEQDVDTTSIILEQLRLHNPLKIKFIHLQQGERYLFH